MSASSKAAVPELPIIQQGDSLLISAQLLHRKLKSGYQFADWVKKRISEYGFEEGQDYFSEKSEKLGVGRKAIDYLFTIDTAKELAMLEKNEIGRSIRRYFIQKEKESRIGILPREAGIFKGLKPKTINSRKMYPYRQYLLGVGYGAKSSGYHYKAAYPGHFITMDNTAYISEELALQVYHSRRLAAAREANKAMQPVLPFNFGEPLPKLQGGSHA